MLVHDYMDLDRDVIFNLLKNNLDDIRGLLKSYLNLV
ncbi:MAG: HepT-like ribonuclease domain-containing protein [Halanaerobium sp.]